MYLCRQNVVSNEKHNYIMKKALVLFLAVFGMLVAEARQVTRIENIPAERYITDFKYNKENFGMTFKDVFMPAETLDRKYVINFYHYYKSVGLFYVQTMAENYYEFGALSTVTDDRMELYQDHVRLSDEIEILAPGSKGNSIHKVSNSELRNVIVKAYQRYSPAYSPEEEGLHVVVLPFYRDKVTDKYVSYYTADEYDKQCWLINSFDIRKEPYIFSFPEDEFRAQQGGSIDVPLTVYAMNEFEYKWESSYDKKTWQTMSAGEMSLVDAKSGATIRNDYQFLGTGERDRYVRLTAKTFYNKLVEGAHGYKDTTEAVMVRFQYPVKNLTEGSWTDHSAGEKIVLKLSACEVPEFLSDLPITVSRSGNDYEFVMPACPVGYTITTPSYKVRFLNVDGTLLKEQTVVCGNAATPPASNPTMSGMTFSGWQGNYTEVTSDRNIYAAYKVDGYELYMNIVQHTSEKTEADLYESQDGEGFAGNTKRVLEGDVLGFMTYVKAAKSATVYFERATYNDNGEIITWGDQKVTTLTDSEAQAGKYITYNEQIGSVYSQKKKTAYRFHVSGYSVAAAYSNIMEFEIWHPLTVNSDRTVTVSNNHFSFTGTSSRIPVFDMDTVRVATAEGSAACDLTFKCAGQWQQKPYKQGEDEKGQYVILFGMQDVMTVGVKSFTVKFIIDGNTEQQTVPCSGMATAPDVPKKDGYIFTGWKKTYSNVEYGDYGYTCVTEDMSFTAQYEKKPDVPVYTVTFLNYDGAVIVSQQVPEGENATPPEMQVREGYTFTGWDGDWHNVSEDLTLTAQYVLGTGVEDIMTSDTEKGAKKVMIDGRLYIVVSGHDDSRYIYDALGTRINK